MVLCWISTLYATPDLSSDITAADHSSACYCYIDDFDIDLPWASCQIRKITGAHAPGMPGTFSPSPQVSDSDMHHGTCVTHVPWCMLGSLTRGLLWSRRQGKRSRYSRCMRNPQFYVSGKRPMVQLYSKHWNIKLGPPKRPFGISRTWVNLSVQ